MSDVNLNRIPSGPERVPGLAGSDNRMQRAVRRERERRRRADHAQKQAAEPAEESEAEEVDSEIGLGAMDPRSGDPVEEGEERGQHVDARA